MRKSQALRLKAGDVVQLRQIGVGRVLTVKGVIPDPTREEAAGTFPLVTTEEDRRPITYRLLNLLVKKA